VATKQPRDGLSPKASLTIALAGIAATLVAALASSSITGRQQQHLQGRNLAAQATATDKVELRRIVDRAENAILRADKSTAHLAFFAHPTHKREMAADDAVAAMDLPSARLTIRLGQLDPLTIAYGVVERGFERQLECPDVDKLVSLTKQGMDGFNRLATQLLGSSVGPRAPQQGRVPSTQELEVLSRKIQEDMPIRPDDPSVVC